MSSSEAGYQKAVILKGRKREGTNFFVGQRFISPKPEVKAFLGHIVAVLTRVTPNIGGPTSVRSVLSEVVDSVVAVKI